MKVEHIICDGCDADLLAQPHHTVFTTLFYAWPEGHRLKNLSLCPKCLKQLEASMAQRAEAKQGMWIPMSQSPIQSMMRQAVVESKHPITSRGTA